MKEPWVEIHRTNALVNKMVFCPKCGGKQSSQDMRFCSRCGFPLGGVVDLVQTDGEPRLVLLSQARERSFYKRVTSQLGAKIIFLSLILLPIAFALAIAVDSPGPFLLPAFIFLLGFAHLTYKLIFGDPQAKQRKEVGPAAERFGLPPMQYQPISARDLKRETAGMTPPSSVTERTTSLLRHEEKGGL